MKSTRDIPDVCVYAMSESAIPCNLTISTLLTSQASQTGIPPQSGQGKEGEITNESERQKWWEKGRDHCTKSHFCVPPTIMTSPVILTGAVMEIATGPPEEWEGIITGAVIEIASGFPVPWVNYHRHYISSKSWMGRGGIINRHTSIVLAGVRKTPI